MIGRVASNIAGGAGLPRKKQRGRGGKRNEPAQWHLTGGILLVGMISKSTICTERKVQVKQFQEIWQSRQ